MAITNAEAAFDAYFEEQCARFGTKPPVQTYERNRNWPVFLQLALICSARGWDPADYVHKTFGNEKRSSECLLVKDLVSRQNLEAYKPESKTKSSVADEYRQCVSLLIQYLSEGNHESSLLLSPMTPFPAWFRVFYPEELDTDIIDAWSGIAKREISSSSGLIEFLNGLDHEKWEKVKKALWFFDDPKGGVE